MYILTLTCSNFTVACTSPSLWPSGLGSRTPIKIHSAFFAALFPTCSRHVVGSDGRGFHGYSLPVLTASHSSQEWQLVFLITSVVCPLTDQLSCDRRVTQGRKTLSVTKQGLFTKFCCHFILKQFSAWLKRKEKEIKIKTVYIQKWLLYNYAHIITNFNKGSSYWPLGMATTFVFRTLE